MAKRRFVWESYNNGSSFGHAYRLKQYPSVVYMEPFLFIDDEVVGGPCANVFEACDKYEKEISDYVSKKGLPS